MGGIVQPTQLPGADKNMQEAQHEVAPFLMNHPMAGLVHTIHANGCTIGYSWIGAAAKVTICNVRSIGGDETGLALMCYIEPEHARSTARSLLAMADKVEEVRR